MKKAEIKKLGIVITVFLSLLFSLAEANEKKFVDIPSEKVAMLHYKSKIDNTSQPLLIKTPANYSTDKSWPLLVVLHGLRDGPILAPKINSMIQIGPYGRGDKWYRGIGEKDVLESIEFAKTIFPINENKIYLTGFSMGGYGTLRLASRYPDMWAACVPVCPRVPEDFRLENCSNVPVWIHTGQNDHRLPPEPCAELHEKSQQIGIDNWLYTEHKGMGHSFSINWKDVEAWMKKHCRLSTPEKIDFSTDDLESNSVYWLKISRRVDSQRPACLKGSIKDGIVNVVIDNISSLKVDFSLCIKDRHFNANKIVIQEGERIVYSGILPENGTFVYDRKNN